MDNNQGSKIFKVIRVDKLSLLLFQATDIEPKQGTHVQHLKREEDKVWEQLQSLDFMQLQTFWSLAKEFLCQIPTLNFSHCFWFMQ